MLPRDLKPEHLRGYPPQARKLVCDHLQTLRLLPLSFLPSLLREAIEYDFRFPVERKTIEREISNLSALSGEQLNEWFREFVAIHLSHALENLDWINAPGAIPGRTLGVLLDHPPNGCIPQSSDRLRRPAAPGLPPELPTLQRLWITIIAQMRAPPISVSATPETRC